MLIFRDGLSEHAVAAIKMSFGGSISIFYGRYNPDAVGLLGIFTAVP
jgi:hypothetical protein